jgi:hypothetical protein
VRRLLFSTLALLCTGALLAQSPETDARQQFYTRLGLSKPQRAQAEALQKKYIDQAYARLAALRKQFGETPTLAQQKQITREMLALQKDIQKRASTELRALLTPTQRKKLDALEATPTIKMRRG